MKINSTGPIHTELLNFLLSNPGYIKKGAPFLAMKLNCTVDQAWKARSEANRLQTQATKNLTPEISPREEEAPSEVTPQEYPIYTPKILILDIETAPNKAYIFRMWKQDIRPEQLLSEWFMLTWAAKWLGSPDVMSARLTPEEALAEDDKRITKSVHNLLNDADIVIAHNGDKFDVPKMKTRFLTHGLPPTSPYQTIDTLLVARKEFGFNHNSLDALARYFKIEAKPVTGMGLWIRCMEGSEDALVYMENYDRGDVVMLEKIYKILRPYIKNHPNITAYDEREPGRCPSCGKGPVVRENAYIYTTVNKYPVFRCTSCGAPSKGRKAIKRATPVELVSVNGKF